MYLFAVFSLAVVNGCAGHGSARSQQQRHPKSDVAVIAGLRRSGLAGYRRSGLAGCRDFHRRFLIAADATFLVFGAFLGCGSFLIRYPRKSVDGFIRNNDRNNNNWGVLLRKDGTAEMAPVYDNGNAFFNKRNPSVSERRVLSDADIKQDALGTNISFFLADDNSHIHPFQYIESLQDPDCTAALIRFSERVDMEAIRSIVENIPERAFGLDVISPMQKRHYIQMMETIIKRSVNPTLERLGRSPVSLHRE